jgi:hypothetical protein
METLTYVQVPNKWVIWIQIEQIISPDLELSSL